MRLIVSTYFSKSFLSFQNCDAEQHMLNHCAKWLTAEFAVVPFFPVTVLKQSSLRQMKPSISTIDCEVPLIIILLKCFLLTKEPS